MVSSRARSRSTSGTTNSSFTGFCSLGWGGDEIWTSPARCEGIASLSRRAWFIAPGLYAREKRLALPFVVMAVIGTAAGAAFSHYLLFPSVMSFFASFDSPAMKVGFRVEDTFTQYTNMLLAMIAVFQLPTIVFFLARLRIVTARFLWQRIQYAVLIAFIGAAVLTPSPDPWNQIVLAAPMLVMYLIGILMAWLAAPRREKPGDGSNHLRLVVAAGVLGQARRRT